MLFRSFTCRNPVTGPGGRVSEDGGSNPTSGYSLVSADSKEQTIALARGCPILGAEGSVEVAEAVEM